MKKIRIFFFSMMCLLATTNAYSQVLLIKNANLDIIGYEDEAGDIRNVNSVVIVDINDSTTILDPTGVALGSFNEQTGLFENSNEDSLFSINANHEVLNAANDIIGKIETGGMVYNNNNELVGIAPGISEFKLAYFFFYRK